jgi:hypothetical protein
LPTLVALPRLVLLYPSVLCPLARCPLVRNWQEAAAAVPPLMQAMRLPSFLVG